MKASVRVEVWSDYVCPFCYLEEPVLNRISQEFAGDVEIRWRAFELRPQPEPTLDPQGDYLREIWKEAVYPMAAERNMTLRLPPVQPRSRLALEAAEFAREHGKFNEMNSALFEAFFEKGKDIGSISVLLDIARDLGLDAMNLREALNAGRYTQRVLDDERIAREIGISGVPAIVTYRVDNPAETASVLSGAQPYERLHASVQSALEGNRPGSSRS